MSFNIVLVARDGRQFWLDEHDNITNKYYKAACIKDLDKITKLIKRFIKNFTIIIITLDGEVVRKYDRLDYDF